MIQTQGLQQFAISVTDLDRAVAFYQELLGCTLVERRSDATVMASGNDRFVLVTMPGHVRPNPAGPPTLETTLFHHAFLVPPDDLGRAIASLDERGIPWFDCTPNGHTTFPGRRHIYIYDPDGNSIELATMVDDDLA